jgi:hypothetical protein
MEDLFAATVRNGKQQLEVCILGCVFFALPKRSLNRFWKALEIAYGAQSDSVFAERLELCFEVVLEELHQALDFLGRTTPVLSRESEQREVTNSETAAFLDEHAYTLRTGSMAFRARKVPALSPASIPIHDDGEVLRKHFRRYRLGGI